MSALDYQVRAPVAMVVFNRPETTARILERIKAVRPRQVFVIADAPRSRVESDRERCNAVREIIDRIDWCQDVRKIYAQSNMGCRQRLASGISAVFDSVPEAIILEDDCLPDLSFFRYCDELLERYRDREDVMSISGANFQYGWPMSNSYYGSRFAHVWGWASWRRAWSRYDVSLSDWPELRRNPTLLDLETPGYREYWTRIFDLVRDGKIDTWDFQWTFAHMRHKAVAITPTVNLVENIGFSSGATHTARVPQWFRQSAASIVTPLSHPCALKIDDDADKRTFRCCNRLRPPSVQMQLPKWVESLHRRLPGWGFRHQVLLKLCRKAFSERAPTPGGGRGGS